MDATESLNQTKRECNCHVVFIPKCRRKTLYKQLRGIRGRSCGGWRSGRRAGSKKDT